MYIVCFVSIFARALSCLTLTCVAIYVDVTANYRIPLLKKGPLSVVSVIHGTSMQLGPSGSFDGVNNGPPKTGYGDFAVYGGLAAASMG